MRTHTVTRTTALSGSDLREKNNGRMGWGRRGRVHTSKHRAAVEQLEAGYPCLQPMMAAGWRRSIINLSSHELRKAAMQERDRE